MQLLQKIHGHQDLLQLDPQQRQLLCREIRDFLVSSVSQTGGHLASNLGVVELSVALETVYNTNIDRLVFDVGHQSYVHKLLTGRQADFAHLRQFGGMAGFPKPSESVTDSFVAGHASSSISIGLGMARARTLQGQDHHVVVVIGDGAATGGMTYEGLNDAAVSGENMVIILNDNEMSIAPNVGGFAQHLSNLRSSQRYLFLKEKYRRSMSASKFSRFVFSVTRRLKNRIKHFLLPTTIFENMGLTYLGPVDGNDTEELIGLLQIAKTMGGPVLLHIHTRKGLGYGPAEENPSKFHGVGAFDTATGLSGGPKAPSFSANFGKTMVELGQELPALCAITAAMPEGTGLTPFMEAFPERIFDVGIAEEHAMSMAGGLAKQGMVPVVALYSTFLQRCYDQILQDIAMLRLHVVLAVDRAGLVGEDGETHHGVFDVGFLRQAPGMTILCPASLAEQKAMLTWAVKEYDGPVAVRYPRGGDRGYKTNDWDGRSLVKCHRQGKDAFLITYGCMLSNVLEAADILAKNGIEATVLRLLQVDPLPIDEIIEKLGDGRTVVIAEEASQGSGIKEALAWALRERQPLLQISGLDLGRQFVTHGALGDLYQHYGLDGAGIAHHVKEALSHEN